MMNKEEQIKAVETISELVDEVEILEEEIEHLRAENEALKSFIREKLDTGDIVRERLLSSKK